MWQLMNLRDGALHAVRRVVISADTNASVAKAVWQTTNDKSDKRQDVAAATKALASTTTIGSAIDKVNLDLIDNGCLSIRGCINLNENYNTSSSVETKLAELDMLFPGIIWPDGSQQARSGLEERNWERDYLREKLRERLRAKNTLICTSHSSSTQLVLIPYRYHHCRILTRSFPSMLLPSGPDGAERSTT
jgi:hypothetical protein